TDETVAENLIRYSACREFHGESTVRFESPVEAGPPKAVEESRIDRTPARLALPAGLPFKLAFTDPIDPVIPAAGDPIRGKFKTAIRDRNSQVLVPEGASVIGRITAIIRYYAPERVEIVRGRKVKTEQPSLSVAVKLETLEMGGISHPFRASFVAGFQRFAKLAGPLSVRVDVGTLDRTQDSDTGVFEFQDTGPDHVIESGLESSWLTKAP